MTSVTSYGNTALDNSVPPCYPIKVDPICKPARILMAPEPVTVNKRNGVKLKLEDRPRGSAVCWNCNTLLAKPSEEVRIEAKMNWVVRCKKSKCHAMNEL